MSIYFNILGAVFCTVLLVSFIIILCILLFRFYRFISLGIVPGKCEVAEHFCGYKDEIVTSKSFTSLFEMYIYLVQCHADIVKIETFSDEAFKKYGTDYYD